MTLPTFSPGQDPGPSFSELLRRINGDQPLLRNTGAVEIAHGTTIVAVTTPFAVAGRASFVGHAPVTLAELARRAPDVERLAEGVVDAFAALSGGDVLGASSEEDWPLAEDAEVVPLSATEDEAIGPVGAGRDAAGRLRVGGELMASRDAVVALEDALASIDARDPAAVSAAVDASLGPPAVVFGVRRLASIRDAIVRAARA